MEVEPTKLDIIWNVTRLCPWDCSICCVDAIHIRKTRASKNILMRTHGLSMSQELQPISGSDPFTNASQHIQASGHELSLSEKFRVVDNFAGYDVRLDISGGDPLVIPENWELLEYASSKLGKSNITVTATGLGVRARSVETLAGLIGEFNFTYDPVLETQPGQKADRPAGYAKANLRLASQLAAKGVFTRAELPLTLHNCRPENLRQIYAALQDNGIHRLLLMRLFPVGRGASHAAATPERSDYSAAIETLRELERTYGKPNVRLQCALRHLEYGGIKERPANPCDLLTKSFGLMADGTLLLSPWAIGNHGQPLEAEWVLGNLARTPLSELVATRRAKDMSKRLDENYGHCKIFAYINSTKAAPGERMLDKTDPLFSQHILRKT